MLAVTDSENVCGRCVQLVINDGRVMLKISTVDRQLNMGHHLNDGAWHDVRLLAQHGSASINVDSVNRTLKDVYDTTTVTFLMRLLLEIVCIKHVLLQQTILSDIKRQIKMD